MVTIDDYLNKLDYLIANTEKESNRIIDSNKEMILDLNRERQLFDFGIDSNGNKLFPEYTNFTVSSKRLFQLPYNRVTLFQTGDFYDAFDLRNQNGNITIFSRDRKTTDLQDKYGNLIFGLTRENQRVLNYEIIKPQLLNFINKHI